MLPALQVEIGDRQGDDADVAGEHLGDDLVEVRGVEGAEPHAMAGRDRLVPAANQAGEFEQCRVAAEALVGVEVDADVSPLRDREEPVQVGPRVGREVRCAADQVHAEVEGGLDRLVEGFRTGQGDELDVHQVAQLLAHPHQRLDPAQRLGAAQDVDVAAHGGRAVAQEEERGLQGPVGDPVRRHDAGVRPPGADREAQVAHRRIDEIPGEGLVEVGVRLRRGGQQKEAGEVEHAVGEQSLCRNDPAHDPAGQLDVDHRAIREGGVGEEFEAAREVRQQCGASQHFDVRGRRTVGSAALEC